MLLLTLLVAQSLFVEGLPGVELLYREIEFGEYEISLSFDGGQADLPWVSYPLFFNPAKTYLVYDSTYLTIEVISQGPYTAEYTYAWYNIDPDGSLILFDQGESDYYRDVSLQIRSFVEEGDLSEAVTQATCVMYPGAMPDALELCVEMVIAAGRIGTLEAFQQVSEVCSILNNSELFNIESENEEYLSALRVYAELADTETALLVRERLENYE